MKKISLLIAQSDKSFTNELEEKLDGGEIKVVEKSNDGEDTLQKINLLKPDILLLDIVMPQLDGFEILEKIKDMNKKPITIILTGINSEYVQEKAINLGADFCFIKPIEPEILKKRIIEISMIDNASKNRSYLEPINEKYISVKEEDSIYNREAIIANYIFEAGISPHLDGFLDIANAINLSLEDENRLSSITKQLYPLVAKRRKTTATRIERNIRNAIQYAWSKNSNNLMKILFKSDKIENRKPKNGEFIATLTRKIKLENSFIDWKDKPKKNWLNLKK